ncbi:MAG: hypothetical protein IJW55_08510 [Clostridia bacterium]|nr:hypothetical protein [Clostridia bacterium]
MKKITCALLSVLLVLSMALVPIAADDVVVGYSDTLVTAVDLSSVIDIKELVKTDASDYDETLGFSPMAYNSAASVKITDAEGLVLFSKIVNSDANRKYGFFDKYVYLAADIDMSGITNFEPIGNPKTGVLDADAGAAFCGIFDGQGHTIKNLVMTSESEADNVVVALFGKLYCGAIINLVIDSTCSFTYTGGNATARTAALVGHAFCTNNSTYTVITSFMANVYGVSDGTGLWYIYNVENNADVSANGGSVAGLVTNGFSWRTVEPMVKNCTNNGDITASGEVQLATAIGDACAGGVVGYMIRRYLTVENCVNTGDVSAPGIAAGLWAGIDPKAEPSVNDKESMCVINSTNSGAITAGYAAGGILGAMEKTNMVVRGCTNTGTVISGEYAGGLVGYANHNAPIIENNTNSGATYSASGLGGGLYGAQASTLPTSVVNCTDNGTLAVNAGYQGVAAEDLVDLTGIADITSLKTTDGTIDVAAYTNTEKFQITTPEGLSVLSEIASIDKNLGACYPFTGKTIYLANDLDMKDVEDFVPIGNDTGMDSDFICWFAGTFDGQGHTISNLKVKASETGNANIGLFGVIEGATIRNLVLDYSLSYDGSSATARVAALAAKGYTRGGAAPATYLIENILVKGDFSNENDQAGGIVGVAMGENDQVSVIRNCTVVGSVVAESSAAGIVGKIESGKLTVEECVNAAIVIGKYASGIVTNQNLLSGNVTTVENCVNLGGVAGSVNEDVFAYSKTQSNVDLKTNQDLAAPFMKEIDVAQMEEEEEAFGVITEENDYGNKVIGYNAAAVVTKDLTNIPPICGFYYADMSATEFKISTPEDLVFFAQLVNLGATFDGFTIYLENDLDMTGVSMTPIGCTAEGYYTDKNAIPGFSGTFDGQGHIIDNLVMTSDVTPADTEAKVVVGLFGNAKSATIKNTVLGAGCSFSYTGTASKAYVAAFAAISFRLAKAVDGAQIDTHTTIENCYSAATVSSTKVAAGFVGNVESNNNNFPAIIINCTNAGNITGGHMAGGIAGSSIESRRLQIESCRNTGAITVTADANDNTAAAGGIWAKPNVTPGFLSYVYNSINNGTVTGTKNVGGIVGVMNTTHCQIKNCSNYGQVSSTADADGATTGSIFGYLGVPTYLHMKDNSDVVGKTDKTVTMVNITGTFPNYEQIDAQHEAWIDAQMPDEPDTPVTPDTPNNPDTPDTSDTEQNTDATTTDAPANNEGESGCGSVVNGFAVAMIAVGGALTLIKKKRKIEPIV